MLSLVRDVKLNKKVIIISFIVMLTIFLFTPRLAFAFGGGVVDTLCNIIGGIISFFADGIVWICDTIGGQFDKLIFNYDGSTFQDDMNLTVLKGETISTQIIQVYQVMQFIGSLVLITISLWITIDFLRTAENPQHKKILKDRLKYMILAIFLLNSIPVIIDVLLAINYAITDTFKLIAEDFMPSNLNYEDSFLTEIFKKLYDEADGSEALVVSIIYLISAFLNLWLVIFYMIRDLGISFLLILAPIMICLLPYRLDLAISWLKEMVSNIFTQSIQAVIFTILIAIVAGLGEDAELYSQIFALVAFAMFIPFTATVKKLLGLEGNIGAAKSTAGLGAAIMTVTLAGKTINGIKNGAGMIHRSNEKIRDLKAECDNLDKLNTTKLQGYNGENKMKPTDFTTSNMLSRSPGVGNILANNEFGSMPAMGENYNFNPNINNKGFPRDRNTIQGEINAIRKQRNSALVKGAASAVGAGAVAMGTSGYGAMGALVGANLGSSIGDIAGTGMAAAGGKAYSTLTEKGKDILYSKGIRPEGVSANQGNKPWELKNIGYNISNMRDNLKSNLQQKSDLFNQYSPIKNMFADSPEEKEKYQIRRDAKQDELTGLTGDPLKETEFYDEEKESRMHTQKLIRQGNFAQASRYRMRSSANTRNLERMAQIESEAINNPSTPNHTMLYTDANSSILFNQNEETGEREVLASFPGNPNAEQPTLESVSFNESEEIPISPIQRDNYKQQAVNIAIEKYGQESVYDNNNEYYQASQNLINNETDRLIDQYRDRVNGIRNQSGSSHLVINGSIDFTNLANKPMPSPESPINIKVPENIQDQPYSRDIYTNIELSRKEMELNQQREFTRHLQQGRQELSGI